MLNATNHAKDLANEKVPIIFITLSLLWQQAKCKLWKFLEKSLVINLNTASLNVKQTHHGNYNINKNKL